MDLSELLMVRSQSGGSGGMKIYTLDPFSENGEDCAYIIDPDTGRHVTPSDLFVDEGSIRLKNMFNLMMTQSNTYMYFSVVTSSLDDEQYYCIGAMNDQMGVMSFASEGWDSDVWFVEFNPTNDGEAQGENGESR